jgi:hypothetical protein
MRGGLDIVRSAPVRLAAVVALLGLALACAAVTPAFANHVQCGDVITTDTVLDSDLVGCPADGIVIEGPNVTLDLNGHTISGSGRSGNDRGVYAVASDGVVIENGVIEKFGYGVYLYGVDGATVRGMTLRDDGSGLWLYGQPTGNLIEDNDISDYGAGLNGGWGVAVEEGFSTGDQKLRPSGNRIERNTVEAQGYYSAGIAVFAVDANVIADNELSLGGLGIELAGYFDAEPSDRNSTEGNVVSGNTISAPGGSAQEGIDLVLGANNNFVSGNRVAGFYEGIWNPSYADANLIAHNFVSHSQDVGIRVGYPPYDVHRIRVVHNRTSANVVDGIRIEAGAYDSVVERNRAIANGDDGIDVDEVGTEVTANWARMNGDWGIEAVPGVIDGGRNFAWGNGQPEQCLNVRCRRGR